MSNKKLYYNIRRRLELLNIFSNIKHKDGYVENELSDIIIVDISKNITIFDSGFLLFYSFINHSSQN